ncbi:tetratricopeptide repeat protein [Sphingobacterium sp. HJSM2_6]|uniref:tetratricopeptide repeat protein n=1 Tax=Sphingobacterium sp. HJSM2_6 TaxID=3366264 RepID=UPI003BF554F5
MMNKNNIRFVAALFMMLLVSQVTFAQSAYKEASNAFALYTQTKEVKHLDNAYKQISNIYKTKKDSSKTRVNVLRVLVLSSLAYADSNRTVKTDKDPIFLTQQTMEKFDRSDLANNSGEIDYVKQNLAAALIFRANRFLQENKFAEAYEDFSQVALLNGSNADVLNNLALLANKAAKNDDAIKYYKEIIAAGNATADQYIELANIYDKKNERQLSLTTLEEAKTKFQDNKSVLFLLIDKYAKNKSYDAIVPIIEGAIKYEPENIDLNYLAGYAHENANQPLIAKKYYEKVLELDANNYEANLALGLLYLNDFLKEPDNQEFQYYAQNFLLKANEIKPYEINALKSLALYYEKAEDEAQLDRVNLLLNQLTN